MELEEAIKICKTLLKVKHEIYFTLTDKVAIETVLDYINILEKATDNKYCYVTGGRTLYSRLKELEKEDLIKAYLRLRNEVNKYIKENSIPKKKIEDKIKELGNITLISIKDRENVEYTIDKLQELLEEEN